MANRKLRIVKRIKGIPVLGICEACKTQFAADPHGVGPLANAQAAIQQQFNVHKCAREDINAGAAPIASQPTQK